MTACLILTDRQAAVVHTSAIVNFHGALGLARSLATMPALVRCFHAEADDWETIGTQIETQYPDMLNHNWSRES